MTWSGVIGRRTIGCGDRGGGGPRFQGKRHEKPHPRHGRSCPGHPPGGKQITIPNWGGAVGGRDRPRPWHGV